MTIKLVFLFGKYRFAGVVPLGIHTSLKTLVRNNKMKTVLFFVILGLAACSSSSGTASIASDTTLIATI